MQHIPAPIPHFARSPPDAPAPTVGNVISSGRPGLAPARVRDQVLRATRVLTTPLLPDDYLGLLNPLWSARALHGRVEATRGVGPATTELTIRPGVGWAGHRPGQHVGIGVRLAGRWHWRTYSITSAPGDELLTVAVTAIPDGSVSAHLARVAVAGDVLRLGPAAGDFAVPDADGPLLMLTGGSGITPVLGMLRGLQAAGTRRDVVLVHSGRTAADLVHGPELRALAATAPWLRLHERHTASAGRMTPGDLDVLVPDWHDRTALVCGPDGLLTAFTEHYATAGLDHALHVERFVAPQPAVSGTGGTVRFTASKVSADAGPTTTLLHAGEDAGALLPSGCRMGICHTCVGRLRTGAVRDLHTGEVHTEPGDLVQTCITAAAGDVEIDL
jgi:stearoyl-CoA 9-desaturase NADPH oxidoreductase